MIGYKAYYNQACKNQKYEPEETYTINGKLLMCVNGFHFCINPDDVFEYYDNRNRSLVIFEVEPLETIITSDNKSVTDKIKITRIIPVSEWNDIFTKYKFDDKGNMVYKTFYGFEQWKEYGENNNVIHYRDSDGFEQWYEYDQNNNIIHYKDSNGSEYWKEYDEDENIIHFKSLKGYEYWYEYDKYGNTIHYRNSYGEKIWYAYDENNNLINSVNSQ